MRKKKLSEIMNHIDVDYIEEVALYKREAKIHCRFRRLKWVGMAVCLAIAVLVGALLIPRIWDGKNEKEHERLITLADMKRPYKEVQIYTDDLGIIWPYEYVHLAGRCGFMNFQGRTYVKSRGLPDQSMIGNVIGTAESEVYEGNVFDFHAIGTQNFDVYKVKGISKENFIVVKIEDKFCLYQNTEYNFPNTFGDLIKVYNLTDNLEFNRFNVCEKYTEKGYFSLEDDYYIWKILSKCKKVTLTDDAKWDHGKRNYLSFTVTMEELGVYKNVFYVTEDGYIWTNMFEFGMLFEIGEDAANKIILYATEHGVEIDEEPYLYSLAGTITEYGNDYILVNDSVLCENPEDGITFKLSIGEIMVRRYIEYLKMEVGDFVMVEYQYGIDTNAENEVKGVVDLHLAYLREDGM